VYGSPQPQSSPKQDASKILLLAERHQRAMQAQQVWATPAKRNVDFFEGRQWTAAQIAKRKDRPSFAFNVIAPLVRLILGYQSNNKVDITFDPSDDARSSDETARALSLLEKKIAKMSGLEFVDVEVFMDGLLTGRGFYDTRLNYESNDLGELRDKAIDPFSVYLDPDTDTYDINESAGFANYSRWVSIDEIEACYGKPVSDLLQPFISGQTPIGPVSSVNTNDEVSPIRRFGQFEDETNWYWEQFYSLMGDFVDTKRKTIRLIDSQHKVRERRNVIIDLETGDKKTLPIDWDRNKIEKVLYHAEQVGNPCVVQPRMVERIQWSTFAGDVMLYDQPSLYASYTISGFFPYFRRGITRGVVDDLIDPQLEKNKRRNAEIEIVSKTANGGWMYHQDSLTPEQKRNLRRFGSTPGVTVEWKGEAGMKPTQIEPGVPAMAHERLESKADDDIRRISGINESALGELDRVQSGRAIEARQRQSVISIQLYMDNFTRTKSLQGRKHLEIIQNHYTEPRLYRVLGEDGKFVQMMINQKQSDPDTGVLRILNDVTVGKYSVTVDNTPLAATFASAQFEEMMLLLEKMGPAIGPYLPLFSDLIIDMSTMPRKDEWVQRMQQVSQALTNSGGVPGAAPAAQQQGQPAGQPAAAPAVAQPQPQLTGA